MGHDEFSFSRAFNVCCYFMIEKSNDIAKCSLKERTRSRSSGHRIFVALLEKNDMLPMPSQFRHSKPRHRDALLGRVRQFLSGNTSSFQRYGSSPAKQPISGSRFGLGASQARR